MYCQKCGNKIENPQAVFCPACGTALGSQDEQYRSQATNNCQQAANAYATDHTNSSQQELPMKWYKFVIWVALIIGPVSNIGNAIRIITGEIYGSDIDIPLLYETFPNLKSVNIVVGIMCIAAALFGVLYVRRQLVGFKSNAIMLFLFYCVIGLIITLIHTAASSAILGVSFSDIATQFIGQLVGTIVFVVLNYIYFNKRKHMFVN